LRPALALLKVQRMANTNSPRCGAKWIPVLTDDGTVDVLVDLTPRPAKPAKRTGPDQIKTVRIPAESMRDLVFGARGAL
jgi:hypothetical protein